MKKKISIIICTYNRAELLNETIKSLLNQTVEVSHYEIIIVNNNSTDNTAEIVRGFIDRYNNIRIVLESKQGLSHARNRGGAKSNDTHAAEKLDVFTAGFGSVHTTGDPQITESTSDGLVARKPFHPKASARATKSGSASL